ncbi:MarR family winged helix-turn-helix transcriptional regulator [Streptomyces sp. NPDC051452]|uniref:MarR family winged helix-turn-helix transcriptional regulator n=1 Tax=Streptomyces sp. NPDC051452 TaxID=3365654 RepID=UPI00379226B2
MTDPSDQRLFFLLQRAAHQLRTTADQRFLDTAGVTTAQLAALYAIRDRPGGTQGELARRLEVRESAVTGLVRRLTAAGLVARDRHPDEHRAVVLELTDEGRAALDAVRSELDRFNAELRAVLGEDGFTRTAEALHRLVEAAASRDRPGDSPDATA